MSRRPIIYFPLVDDQIEEKFEDYFFENFVLHLLFRGDLAITDGFWFASRLLRKLPMDIVISCLRHGAIRPWFRNSDNEDGSFLQAYTDWKDTTLGLNELNEVEKYLRRLDELLLVRREDYMPHFWPDPKIASVSENFAKTVKSRIAEPLRPATTEDKTSVKIWNETYDWRTTAIADAIGRSGGKSMLRGQLLQVVGEMTGITIDQIREVEGGDRIQSPKPILKFSPVHQQINLKYFFSWISDCYAISQAEAFGIDRTFSPGIFYEQLVPFGSLKIDEGRQIEIFPRAILVPKLARLRTCNFEELLKVRESEGQAYFDAVTKYPSDIGKIEGAFEVYAKALRQRFSEIEDDSIEIFFSHIGYGARTTVATLLAALEIFELSRGLPPLLTVIAGSATLLYRAIPRDRRHEILRGIERISFEPRDKIKVTNSPVQVAPDDETD